MAEPQLSMTPAELKALLATGSDENKTKAASKAAKQLAELNGKIQKQLQQQQNQYALAQQAQQAAASLAQQREQQAYQKPFTEAELTGYYNGTKTLQQIREERDAREFQESQAQQNTQFNANLNQNATQFEKTLQQQQQELTQTGQLEQQRIDLSAEIQRRQATLAELDTQQKDAIARGNLQLAQELGTRKQALEEQNSQAQNQLAQSQTSGFMQNGQLTEQARAARVEEALKLGQTLGLVMDPNTGMALGETQEAKQFNAKMALEQTQTMGVDAQGNQTDASQQWRTNAGLEYAKTAAALSANPADYFESAAFMRNAGVQDPMSFLNQINQNGTGSNVGFRSAAQGLPSANSMQNVAGGGSTQQQPTGVNASFASQQAQMPLNTGEFTSSDPGMGKVFTLGAPSSTQQQTSRLLNGVQTNYYDPNDIAKTQGQAMPNDVFTTNMGGFNEATGSYENNMPKMAAEGPSASVSQATAANSGQNVAYSTSMNRPQPSLNLAFNQQQTAYADPAAQRLAAFAPVFQAGAHKMQAGSLEAMSPTERALFKSAAGASGVNDADWESAYKRSRLQTNVSANAI